jgi:predicted glycoside hydrolase/deacetylase ChbG (UPF0249 family)
VTVEENGARTAEREKPATRRIWLCADDYGLSHGVNAAIRDLVLRGRINATSVMVIAAPGRARSESASLAILNADRRRVAIGLHLTLTSPFKPLSRDYRTTRNGEFLPLATTFALALGRGLRTSDLRAEVIAQIEAFKTAFGRRPDFVDGHQHVHVLPQVREAVLSTVREVAPEIWVRQCGSAQPLIQQLGERKGLVISVLSRAFRRRAEKLGIATNPAFAGTYDFRGSPDFASLFPQFLEGLPDGGVVMCHPGFVDDELRALDPLTDQRAKEHAFFAGEEYPRILKERGVTLA